MQNKLRISFMGTPEFAVPSLDILFKNGYELAPVVTVPDKPSGRGRKVSTSPVKDYAMEHHLPLLQPANLKSEEFINQFKLYHPNLLVVVAFRMLPVEVYSIPAYGSFNLHASLLPQYRGAAPINHAIINGETKTGLTTFFIDKLIDTGSIIFRKEVLINPDDNAGTLHDKLKYIGAGLVLRTVQAIEQGNVQTICQSEITSTGEILKPAPKIFKEDCLINWNSSVEHINNFVRGLSPYPCAYTILHSPDGREYQLRIFKGGIVKGQLTGAPGTIVTDQLSYINIFTRNGIFSLDEIQIAGKKRLPTAEFLRGFTMDNNWQAG